MSTFYLAPAVNKWRRGVIEVFFDTWSAAHLEAGFSEDAAVLIAPLPRPAGVSAGEAEPPVAPSQPIPESTLAWATVVIRPHDIDHGLVMVPSQSTEGNKYLDVELTILEGPYTGRKVCDIIGLEGAEEFVQMGLAKVRHILEVGREIDGFAPTDPKYRLGQVSGTNGEMVLMELNELRCAVKIGVEPGKGQYADKNKIRAYLSPNPASDTHKTWLKLLAGDTAPPAMSARGNGSTRHIVPPAIVTVPLSSPKGIAEAYAGALGAWVGSDRARTGSLTFGAVVGLQTHSGAIETALALFEEVESGGSKAGGPIVDDLEDNEEATVGEEGRQASRSGISRLVQLAGGLVGDPEADGSECQRTLSGGFFPVPLISGGREDEILRSIGGVPAGTIWLDHITELSGVSEAQRPHMDLALLLRAAAKWRLCGGNFDVLVKLPGVVGDRKPVTFVVPGWIPRGELSIVAGDSGLGKSTLFHELALLVGTPTDDREQGREWLGVPVGSIAHGTSILISGEEGAAILDARSKSLGSQGREDIIELPLNGADDPAALLASLRSVPNVVLLVVDPARSFIRGNEDDSGNVDQALSILARYAAETGCAVVVLHHLKKNARPSSPHDAVEGLRGSGAFKARARCAIGMVRRGDLVSIGVAKHNIPPPLYMQTETKRFRRDQNTLRLVAPEGAGVPAAGVEDPAGDVARIVQAVAAARSRGQIVMRSGKRFGIYELALPELDGISRNSVRATAQRALDIGALTITIDGHLVPRGVDDSAVPDVAGVPLATAGTPGTKTQNAVHSTG